MINYFKIISVTLKDCPYGAKLNLEQGYIQSPEFSTGGYTTAYICSWVITVPEGSKVALKFHSFEVSWNTQGSRIIFFSSILLSSRKSQKYIQNAIMTLLKFMMVVIVLQQNLEHFVAIQYQRISLQQGISCTLNLTLIL